jgi:hypothetical protein
VLEPTFDHRVATDQDRRSGPARPVADAGELVVVVAGEVGGAVGGVAANYDIEYVPGALYVGAASSLVTLAAIPFEGGATVDFGGMAQLLVAGTSGVTFYDLDQLTVGNLPLPPDMVALHVNYSPDGNYIAYSTDANQLFATTAQHRARLHIRAPPRRSGVRCLRAGSSAA